jgi:hypothetical protein
VLANIGRYAREPNLGELFGRRGVIVGNPRLRPEVAFNARRGVPRRVPAALAARPARGSSTRGSTTRSTT